MTEILKLLAKVAGGMVFQAGLLLALVVLSVVVRGDPVYSRDELDFPRLVYATTTVAGHIITFGAMAWYVRRVSFGKFKLPVILGFSAIQLFWRLASVSLNHIDCGNSCVSTIIPESFDMLVLWIVAAFLLAANIWMFLSSPKSVKGIK